MTPRPARESVTVTLASPAANPQSRSWQVFGTYEGDDDRFVFGVRDFGQDYVAAKHYADRLAERHGAARVVTA